MKRKIHRNEMRDTVVNLIDLHFSVAAIAFMTQKTEVNIYSHLKAADRMKGRDIIRKEAVGISDAARAALRRLSSNPRWLAMSLLTVPSGIVSTSRKSAKRAA